MKFLTLRNSLLVLATAAGVTCLPALTQAQTYTYHVDINVASLIVAGGNYSLDVQLNGDGLPATATNTVTLSNISFTLGGTSGAATGVEGASGNFSSSVILSLSNSNQLNELYQGFTGTTTGIHFDVTTTQNGSGITPDLFLVQILNGSLNPIATNAPGGTNDLLTQPINGTVTLASISAYSSTSPAGVTVSAVPEPTTGAAILVGLGACGIVLRRRKR